RPRIIQLRSRTILAGRIPRQLATRLRRKSRRRFCRHLARLKINRKYALYAISRIPPNFLLTSNCVKYKIRRMKEGDHKYSQSEVIKEIPLACSDETAAVGFFEKQRWGDCPCCAHCGSVNVYKMM